MVFQHRALKGIPRCTPRLVPAGQERNALRQMSDEADDADDAADRCGGYGDGETGTKRTRGSCPAVALLVRGAALGSHPVGTFTPSMKLPLGQQAFPAVILTNLLSHAVGTASLGLLWLAALPRRRCVPEDTPERGAVSSQRIQLATSD